MIYFAIYIVYGVIWGVVTNAVIKNKGYSENWFFLGFFFGFIAFIVACTKPQNNSYSIMDNLSNDDSTNIEKKGWICLKCGTINPTFIDKCKCGYTKTSYDKASSERNSFWKCGRCGKMVPNYIGTCDCGYSKNDNYKSETNIELTKNNEDNFQEIKKYKDLLDSGIITQEEFEVKKKQLLNL